MNSYPQLLDQMMGAILARDLAPAPTLYRDKKDFPPPQQLAIYVEGYRARLQEVLESTYPALAHYLGKPDFAALAAAFIQAHPSRHFNLDKYPVAFGACVARESADAFAGELAMLESAIHEVYQAPESPELTRGWIESQTPESLAASPLLPRAASRLFAFAHPVNAYVNAFRDLPPATPGEETPSRLREGGGGGESPRTRCGVSIPSAGCRNTCGMTPIQQKSYLLVLRHKHQVARLELAEAEHALLSILAQGKTLAEALEDERFAPYAEGDDMSATFMGWFARWVEQGVLRQPL